MNLTKREHVVDLVRPHGIGIELGVAEGVFSERVLIRSSLLFLYSVDMYAGDRGHDIEQYRAAIRRLMPYKFRNTILKMRFDEALPLFPDRYFDFIYVDGYAHTGQENGTTFEQWYPKLADGGVFAGDDYEPEVWPETFNAVNRFALSVDKQVNVIDSREPYSRWSESRTWWWIK